MLPWVYGFTWQTGNVIFLTVFYAVVALILTTFGVAAVRAYRDLKSNHMDKIRWHIDFNDLPDFAKTCRHVFTGELNNRVCANGFDCRTCGLHANLAKVPRPDEPSDSPKAGNFRNGATSVFGLDMPTDRLYHRGHTWVRKESDGTLTIGLDDFGERLIGKTAYPELPEIGTMLAVNETGWHFTKDNSSIRILSPVQGEVIAVGDKTDEYYLKVRASSDCDLRNLLKGSEVRPWIMRERGRLEIALSAGKLGISLADGGVMGEMFLQP